MLKYIIGTCIKEYNSDFDVWLNTVKNFKPPPYKIGVATESETFPTSKEYEIIPVKGTYNVITDSRIERITLARETLRKWIVTQDSDLAILLDSDVIPLNDYFPVIMFGTLSLLGGNILFNDFPNKDGYPDLSLGCIACSSSILKLLTFHPITGLSDDSVFLLDLLNIKRYVTDIKILRGKIVQVLHKGDKSIEPDLNIIEIGLNTPLTLKKTE